jgi:D-alanine-D-alanine ligase
MGRLHILQEKTTMNIGITYDLRSDYLAAGYGEEETAEFDQEGTIDAIDSALVELGYVTDRIGSAQQLIERLARGDRWDLVFNICEGLRGIGREAQVPAILDVYGIPYTFGDPAVLVACLDKALTKTIVRAARLPTPDWHVVRELPDCEGVHLPFPLLAKPVAEGTGKGIDATSKVVDQASLRQTCGRLLERYRQPVLVERFLPGREFTVGILGSGRDAEVVGTMEIVLLEDAEPGVYSYVNKEQCAQLVKYAFLPSGSDPQATAAEETALAAWLAVGGLDAGRIDLRCDDAGRPQLIEVNPLAGIHPTHSDLPMIWTAFGRDYVELIDRIVRSAAGRAQGLVPTLCVGTR